MKTTTQTITFDHSTELKISKEICSAKYGTYDIFIQPVNIEKGSFARYSTCNKGQGAFIHQLSGAKNHQFIIDINWEAGQGIKLVSTAKEHDNNIEYQVAIIGNQ